MNTYAFCAMALAALATVLTRTLPFLLFGGQKQLPALVQYLGKVLPPCILAVLVVYCLKDLPFSAAALPQLVAVGCVVLLHRARGNTLLSIFGGTALYMLLIRLPLFV